MKGYPRLRDGVFSKMISARSVEMECKNESLVRDSVTGGLSNEDIASGSDVSNKKATVEEVGEGDKFV